MNVFTDQSAVSKPFVFLDSSSFYNDGFKLRDKLNENNITFRFTDCKENSVPFVT